MIEGSTAADHYPFQIYDCWTELIGHLTYQDRFQLSCASKTLFNKVWSSISYLFLRSDALAIMYLPKLQNSPFGQNPLQKVILSGYLITDRSIPLLQSCNNLKSLGIKYCRVSDPVFKQISGLSALLKLEFCRILTIDDKGFRDLKIESLTSLKIRDCNGINEPFTQDNFEWFQSLKILQLDYISDNCLLLISSFVHLTLLHFKRCRSLTDKGISKISNLSNLKNLKLFNCPFLTPKGLSKLKELKNLHTLALTSCVQLTDELLLEIISLNLTSLDLSSSKLITGESISSLVNLESLDLSFNLNSINLKELTNLKTLCLSRCPRTDEALQGLSKLTNLTDLRLEQVGLTNQRFQDFSGLTNLTRLHLGQNGLDDSIVGTLKQLTKLRDLDLTGCALTDKALLTLRLLFDS